MKKLYTLVFFLSLFTFTLQAQTTLIPDANFEQALIDLGIDSDAEINGQVLTSDLENVTDLDLSNLGLIEDLTGIEDFHNLENLDVSMTSLSGELDLSTNTNLTHLTAIGGGDNIVLMIEKITLNNNPNLEQIIAPEIYTLEQIDLRTDDEDVSDLLIDISIIAFKLTPNSTEASSGNICIQVTQPDLAESGEGVYSNWVVITDESTEFNDYFFSETCTLNTTAFEKSEFQLYPNPARNQVQINASEMVNEVKVFDVSGKLIHRQTTNNQSIVLSTQDWGKGMYLINLFFANGQQINKKLIVD